ncbi:I78 family peptidase inhibitor [Pseudooceanicola sp.]|uniref:I78 family peptidase inhibitor n=1 Tax=Pseudooceanicola sp. TaxID=1914328 RepID=UPI0035C7738F
MRAVMVFSAVLALAGCREAEVIEAGQDACGASGYGDLLGKGRAAIVEAGLVEGPDLRVFGPGAALTMDHRPGRLNIELDADGRIVAVRCG